MEGEAGNEQAAPSHATAANPIPGFWPRVREHKIIQWGVGYLGAALALAQGEQHLGQAFGWPDTVTRLLMIALVIGFPIALTVAWYHGHRGLKQISAGELAIVSALLLIGAVFFTAVSRPSEERDAVASERTAIPGASDTVSESVPPPRPVIPNSVAALPLDNLGADTIGRAYALGMHSEIISQLTKLRRMTVINRQSVMVYAENRPPLERIAAELGAESLLVGSFRLIDEQIRISVQLVDPATGANRWSEDYQSSLGAAFEVQADIAMNVANALAIAFSAAEQADIERRPTASVDALGLYYQALAVLSTVESDPRVVPWLEQAIQIDPNYASAHALLAFQLSRGLANSTVGEAVDAEGRTALATKVRLHVDKALELDAREGRAYAALATLEFLSWRWTEAEPAFQSAIEASPQIEIIAVYFGMLLSYLGRQDEAIAMAERMNAVNPAARGGALGFALGYSRDYDRAAEVFRQVVQRSPQLQPIGRLWLGFMEIARGNEAEAIGALEFVERVTANNRLNVYLAELTYGFGRVGRQDQARRLFEELEAGESQGAPLGAGTWAMAYLGIGDRAKALAWLEVGAQRAADHEPDPGFIQLMNLKMNITNDPVLREPEFVDVLSRIRGD